MRNKCIWKILAISVAVMIVVSCITPSIAVGNLNDNALNRSVEAMMPFYTSADATIYANQIPFYHSRINEEGNFHLPLVVMHVNVNAKSSIEWHTSDQNAMQIAKSQNKPTMILFSSDRCPASAKLADEFADTRVINMSKKFVPIVGSGGLDRQYGIRYVPTIVFTNSQGEEVYRTVGYRDADTLVQEMQYALSLSTTLNVPFFSQRDPAWCDKKLDHSPYSIGEYGCALTSAAMVAKYFGYDTDPGRLNVSLTEVEGLDTSGILYWEKVEEVSGGKVEWIGRAEGNWSRIDQELGNKNPVIAEVSCSLGNHFIVFIGKVGTDYYFLDPYDETWTANKWPNGAHGDYTLNNLRIYHRGRQQLVEAIEELELAIIDSIDYDVRHVADSYALLAAAAELTPWWRELARLAVDTIHAVVGTVIEVGEFLTPKGANQVLEDPSTCQQVINGVKDSKDILAGIATSQGLVGLYRNADSYKLSFEAINTVEEVARQEYEVSGDFDRTANAAWLELWNPSTPNGLLIPLKTEAPLKEGSRSSVSRWVNGLKEVREEVKNSFDDVITEIPDPLPADYPLAETITYLKNLKQQIRGGGYRVVEFKGVEDDKEIKRHITLGMVQEGREATSLLYTAWMDDLDVQYTSTLHNTGETIMHVTTYGFPATGVTKKVVKGVSDLYEVIDIIQLPSDLVNLIDKPVHPLDALQNHTVKMNNDLVHETSNLWTLSEGTLKYLQYTGEPAEDSTPPERVNADELKAMILASVEEVDTYKFDMNVVMKMLLSNETNETEMTTISNGRGVLDVADKKMKLNMNTSMETNETTEMPGPMEMEMYLINSTMYTKMDRGMPGLPPQWTKMEMPAGYEEYWASQNQLEQQMELLNISEVVLLADEELKGVDP